MEDNQLTPKEERLISLAVGGATDKDLIILDEIDLVKESVSTLSQETKSQIDEVSNKIDDVTEELKKKLDEELHYEIDPEAIRGFPGKDGENYILTPADKAEIASKITVPIVEKVIEKTETIREIPQITEVTNINPISALSGTIDTPGAEVYGAANVTVTFPGTYTFP